MSEQKRVIGKIFAINPGGYGFISSKDIPFERIFFHWSALNPSAPKFTELKKGDEVEFSAVEFGDRGWRALKIDVLEDEKK